MVSIENAKTIYTNAFLLGPSKSTCVSRTHLRTSAQLPTNTVVAGMNRGLSVGKQAAAFRWRRCPHRQSWGLPPDGRKANTMPAKRTAFLLRSVRRRRTACSAGKHDHFRRHAPAMVILPIQTNTLFKAIETSWSWSPYFCKRQTTRLGSGSEIWDTLGNSKN